MSHNLFATAVTNAHSVDNFPKPVDFVMSYCPGIRRYSVAGVTFDGVDVTVFDFFDDADVIGLAVLAFAFAVPVEVDDVAGGWDVGDGLAGGVGAGGLLPTIAVLEPLDTGAAAGGFGQGAVLDVAALVGAPGDEAGAPLHAARVAHVGPVGLAAVAHLGQGNGNKGVAAGAGAVEDVVPEGHVLV